MKHSSVTEEAGHWIPAAIALPTVRLRFRVPKPQVLEQEVQADQLEIVPHGGH